MRKWLLLLLLILAGAVPAAAQQTPDYSIRSIRIPPSSDSITVQFEVINSGAAATTPTTATLRLATSQDILATEPVPALDANQQTTVSITVPPGTQGLTPGERVLVLISVGVGDIEAANSNTVGDNTAMPTITVPAGFGTQPATDESSPPVVTIVTGPFRLPTIDLSNPLHVALLIAAGGVLLILIWMVTIILRLIFSRPPTFTTWQPPYTYSPLLDPNSTAGRRQLWQQHAQSDMLPPSCAPGSFMARKALIGMDGEKLHGWRIVGLRISQYDMYGRVTRSQTIAPNGVVKSLDSAARKAAGRTPNQIERMVRPAAKRLNREFSRKLKRTRTLPIALDVRLRGTHGEVRIIFELYQCVDGQWRMADQWEPEMAIFGGTVFENFTYSLYGQQPGETPRQFRRRLQDDLTRMLTAMIQRPPTFSIQSQPEPSEATANIRPVSGDPVRDPVRDPATNL